MKILGVEPFSRQGKIMKTSLQKAGFRLGELMFVNDCPEILETGEHFVLALGAGPLRELCGDYAMAEVSGQILEHKDNPDCLVIPNYAPGFLYHNPNMKGLWEDNLKLCYIAYKLETEGVIV